MKVYKVSYHHPDLGCQVAWVASRQEANRVLRAARHECVKEGRPGDDIQPTRVELHNIPTTRAGLLHWLNTWVDTDNG